MALLDLQRGVHKGRAVSLFSCRGGSSWVTVGSSGQGAGVQTMQVETRISPIPRGFTWGPGRSPFLQKHLGDGSRGVTKEKVPASAPHYHHQCPSLCKAPTNSSTQFACVQTVRSDSTGVLFHVVMDFPHYISLCWATTLGNSLLDQDKPFYTHKGSNSLFIYTHKTLQTVRRAEQVEMAAEFECRNW